MNRQLNVARKRAAKDKPGSQSLTWTHKKTLIKANTGKGVDVAVRRDSQLNTFRLRAL